MNDFMQFIQTTVKAVTEISPFPISVSDARGYIIGDSNSERIGTFHQPSSDVLRQNSPQLFHRNDWKERDNVLPGVALPLEFDSEKRGVLGIIGEPEEVLPYAQLIKRHVEVMWQDAIRSQMDDLETSLLGTFIQYILLGESSEPQKIDYYCDMLHIDPSLKRYCILIDIGDALLKRKRSSKQLTEEAQFRKQLVKTVNYCFSKGKQDLASFLNTEKIIFIKSVPTEDAYRSEMQQFENRGKHLLEMFRSLKVTNASVAAGGLCADLADMHTSYREAESLIQYGKALPASSRVFSYYQWETLKTLLPYEIKPVFREKLQTRLVSLFQDKQYSALADSFIVYCRQNLNLSQASKELYLHRNTLIYRLKKIERLTGLDLDVFTDCMLLYIVLVHTGINIF